MTACSGNFGKRNGTACMGHELTPLYDYQLSIYFVQDACSLVSVSELVCY